MSRASVALNDVPGISKRVRACCRRAALFSAHEVLLISSIELQHLLRVSRPDAELLQLQVAKAAAPPVHSTLDILQGSTKHAEETLEEADDDGDSSESSDSSQLPSATFMVPPTPGYDGNFPGMQSAHAFNSDSDSDEEEQRLSDASSAQHSSQSIPEESGMYTTPLDTTPLNDYLVMGRTGYLHTSGSLALDEVLNGGFRCGSLSEIVGESSSGKTQLAIQVCVFAALNLVPFDSTTANDQPVDLTTVQRDDLYNILGGLGVQSGAGSGSSYITSSGERGAHAIVRRALQLTEAAIRDRFQSHYANTKSDDLESVLMSALQLAEAQVLQNIHIACVGDVEALEHALHYTLPGLIAQTTLPIGVVVVDSLPDYFQADSGSDLDWLVQRSHALTEIADALKRISVPNTHRRRGLAAAAGRQGAAVLVLNHVSDAFDADKEVAKQFVYQSSSHSTASSRVWPDYPANMNSIAQSAFYSGLLASIPPTLAESVNFDPTGHDGQLYALKAKTAQLGPTWSNNINMRLFLSQTRGRVAAPLDARHRLTVRRAAVVFSAFGPSMLDPLPSTSTRKWRAEERQIRFVITANKAVHALPSYTVRTTTAATATPSEDDYFTPLDDRDLMELDLDAHTTTTTTQS